jgi:hypothetical protein
MRFEEKAWVRDVALMDMGASVRVTWNYLPEYGVSCTVLGFIITCTTGETREACRRKVASLGEDTLVSMVSDNNSGWLIPMDAEPGLLMAHVNYTNMTAGFSAMSSCFRAPCRVEVWTLIRTGDTDEVVVLWGEGSGSACYRKLQLQCKLEEEEVVERTGLFRRTVNVSYNTTLTITPVNRDADYKSGAVCYRLAGYRYPYPLGKESMGQPLRFPNRRGSEISVEIDPDYRALYQLVPQ